MFHLAREFRMLEDTIKIHRVFGEGLAWFVARPWFWIGTIVIYIVISVIVEMVSLIFSNKLGPSTGSESFAYALGIVCFLLEVFVYIRMRMGLAWMTVSTTNGKSMEIGDLFAKSQLFWRFLFGSLLYHLMCLAGFMLFFVPGIYLAARFFPVHFVVIERETGVMESFRQAQQLTEGSRGKVIDFILLWIGIAILSAIAVVPVAILLSEPVGMGVLLVFYVIATPIIWLSAASLYRALRDASTNQAALA